MANTTGYGYLLGPAPQFFDANGKPLVGGKLFVYIAGTTTTAVTYSDFNRTENTSPVILNDLGTCMLIVPSANLYKIALYDRNGNLLLTRDNVSVSSGQQIIYTTANKVDSSDSTVDVTATTDPDTGMVTYDLSIQKEIYRAEKAEGALAEDIADETDRAAAAEKALAGGIESETQRATAAEKALAGGIEDETDRATAAEKAAKTEIVAGDNITVTKTVGADGQDVYTIDGEDGGSEGVYGVYSRIGGAWSRTSGDADITALAEGNYHYTLIVGYSVGTPSNVIAEIESNAGTQTHKAQVDCSYAHSGWVEFSGDFYGTVLNPTLVFPTGISLYPAAYLFVHSTAQNALWSIKNLTTSITAFRTGDVIPVDGPNGTAKMSKDDLLKVTAQNALAGKIVASFNPSKSNGPDGYAYHEKNIVEHNGEVFVFVSNKATGAWDSTTVKKTSIEEMSRRDLVSPLSASLKCSQGRITENGLATNENLSERVHTGWIAGDGNSYVMHEGSSGNVCIGFRIPKNGMNGSWAQPFNWTASYDGKIVFLDKDYQYMFVFAKNDGTGNPSSSDAISTSDISLSLELVNPFPVTLDDLDTNHYVTDNNEVIELVQGTWNNSGATTSATRLRTNLIAGTGQKLILSLDSNFVCIAWKSPNSNGSGGLWGNPFNWSTLNKKAVTLKSGYYYSFVVARNNGSGQPSSSAITTNACKLYNFVATALILQHSDEIAVLQSQVGSDYTKTLVSIGTNSSSSEEFVFPASGYTATSDYVKATADNAVSNYVKLNRLYAIDKRCARLVFEPADSDSVIRFFCVPPVVSTTGTGVIVDFSSGKISLISLNSDGSYSTAVTQDLSNVLYVAGHKYVAELIYDAPNNKVRVWDDTTGKYDEIEGNYVEGSNSVVGGFHKGRYSYSATEDVKVYSIAVYSEYEHPYVIFFGASQNEASYFITDHTNYEGGEVVSASASTMRNGYAYKFVDEVLQDGHNGLVSGISGTSWNEVYQRLLSEALPLRPDYVVIMVGNNSWDAGVAANCLDLLRDNGIKTLLFNIPAAFLVDGSGGITGNQDYQTIATRNGYIDALRASYGLDGAKINVSNSLNNDGEHVDTSLAFYTSGYFPHPNQAGVAKILNRIKLDLPWFK